VIEGTTTEEMLRNSQKLIKSIDKRIDALNQQIIDALMRMHHHRAVELFTIDNMYWRLWSRRSAEFEGLMQEGTISSCISAGHLITLMEARESYLKSHLGRLSGDV
jgi:hypothetical protein